MISEGTWKIMKTTESSWHIYTGSEGNEVILAAVRNQDFKSNAHLVATAPELLEACKLAVLVLTHEPISPHDIDFIKEAIAKAENN